MNILGEFDSKGYICIDMKQDNMLVIHPDFLVSGSVIAGATMCVRRYVSTAFMICYCCIVGLLIFHCSSVLLNRFKAT